MIKRKRQIKSINKMDIIEEDNIYLEKKEEKKYNSYNQISLTKIIYNLYIQILNKLWITI